MASDLHSDPWSLEVVRGAEPGRRFVLAGGTVVLGNALDGMPGIDLSPIEATSPRKMAGRQAQIHVANGSISLRDLDSPGGTFVEHRRVPPNSDLPLKVGDVIQLGGVQLRVARGNEPAPAKVVPPSPTATPVTSSSFLFTFKAGPTCRSWDDFLVVSAQKWGDLRDELVSGRLASFLATMGRSDLTPDPRAPGTPDERLDAWLRRLPAIKPLKAELEVHPAQVSVRAPSGGGVVRKKLQVSNSGFGLLKIRARVEPSSATWLAIGAEFLGREVAIIESMDLTFDVTIPESIGPELSAELVIDGNGGTTRVAVRVEPFGTKSEDPIAPAINRPGVDLGGTLSRVSSRVRLVAFPIVAIVARLGISAFDAIWPGAAGSGSPGLLGPSMAFAAIGAVLGLGLAWRSSGMRDLPSVAFASAVIGAMASAIAIATCRAIEAPAVALVGGSVLVSGLVWGVFGLSLGALSLVRFPPRAEAGVKP